MKKLFILLALLPFTAFAESGDFDLDRWFSMLNDVQNRAVAAGISNHTINEVIQPAVLIPGIIKSDKNQAEFKLSLDEYLTRTVNQTRITNGHKMAQKYPTLLGKVYQKYGVPPEIILAFWGLESNYGEFKAKYKLSDAFLTLMYDGRREKFFDSQLFALMKSADKDKIEISKFRGSWAGAMGHFQFIPTTLEQYGVDGNGDGRIDIINNISDAMFSAGNYLNKLGWDSGGVVAEPVSLPPDFDMSLCDAKTKKSVAEWNSIGIFPSARANDVATGIVCDANVENSKAFITYPNFYRVKKWNNSNWYAIAVSELSGRL